MDNDFVLTVEVSTNREEKPYAKSHYTIKVYRHPLTEGKEPEVVEWSDYTEPLETRVGKAILNAIY